MNNFKLDTNPKLRTGFSTPENYFDRLPDKVLARLQNEVAEDKKVIPIYKKRLHLIYAAAAVLIFALMIPVLNTDESTVIDTPTLENYLAVHSNLNQFDLIGLLEEEDIDNIALDTNFDNEAIEDILSDSRNLENLLIE